MFSGYSWDIGGGVSYKRCCSPNYCRTSQERMAPAMALPPGGPLQTLSSGGIMLICNFTLSVSDSDCFILFVMDFLLFLS